MQDLSGSETKMLNLEGKIVVPGLIDSHVHLIFGGLQVFHNSIVLFLLPLCQLDMVCQ